MANTRKKKNEDVITRPERIWKRETKNKGREVNEIKEGERSN